MNSAKPISFNVRGLVPLLLLAVAHPSAAQLTAGQKDDIGFTALQGLLGGGMPTGAGVSVSQVEARESGVNYRPDTSQFPGKNFVFGSGGSTGASSHATIVGNYFYGAASLAPGIGVSPQRITSYDADGFIQGDLLQFGVASQLPGVEANDVQNHSWIGSTGNAAFDQEILRRVDYAIQRDNFVATFGLNNGSGTGVPNLLGAAYNGIAVGLSNGEHSRGGTVAEGIGRTKPDIVVPTDATSWATPTVGSAAALLIQTSRTTGGLGAAEDSRVIKSLLLTGASRSEAEFTWSNSETQPLDAVYGAGELDIRNSHQILTAGQGAASNAVAVGAAGWDKGNVGSTTPNLYFFDLTNPDEITRMAATLVWNREVIAEDTQPGPAFNYVFNSSLADLNLRLFSATGFILGSELAASTSSVDNVELISFGGLAPGRYAWQVSSNTDGVDYGISWYGESVQVVPEPQLALLLSVGVLGLALGRRRGGGG